MFRSHPDRPASEHGVCCAALPGLERVRDTGLPQLAETVLRFRWTEVA